MFHPKEQSISHLHIQLLGDFRLVYDNIVVTTVNTARLQALLACLLLGAGVPRSRQEIAYLFWPDSNEARARNSLRNLLHRLRQALPMVDEWIQIDDQAVAWRVGTGYTLDVTAFDSYLTQATTGDETAAQLALEKGIALYQGDLLPGCYDDWVAPQRARLRLAYGAALERLVQLYIDRREYRLAFQTAERWRQHDPVQETVYLYLLRIAVASGDHARAHRVYQEVVDLLQQELGVAPGPELSNAYAALRNQPASSAAVSTQSGPTTGPDAIVGRVGELASLQQNWRTLQPGHPQVVLLSGEPGIGKSRLAHAFMAWVEQQHYPTISAHCYAGEGSLAYAPLVEWLRTPVVTKAIGKLDKLWQSELLRLLPELRNQYPRLPNPAPLREAWQRRHFFEALAHALLTLPQPLLLFLDDWQWCDWETLEWLNFLLRFATYNSLFVLGAMRRDEVSRNSRLQTLLLGWQRQGWLTEITVGPLGEADTVALASQVAGYRLPPAQARALAQETEGNPLFVVEIIRAHPQRFRSEAARSGATPPLTIELDPKLELPAKVQAVIEYRLAQLSPLILELAGSATVIGRRFTFGLLVGASGEPEEAVLQGLDELCQRRIVQEVEGGVYDFCHEKVREVAYLQLSATRRQFLHRKVGQTITQLATDEQAAVHTQAAFHFEQANSLDQALRHYIQAAAAAADMNAYHRAAQLYARAAEVAGKLNLPSATLVQIYTEHGRMLEHTGEFVAAIQVYQSLEALARRRADKTMEATAVAHLATAYSEPTSAHALEQAQTMFARGVALAQELGDHDLAARLLWSQMVIASHYDTDVAAQTAGAASLTLCRQNQLQQRLPYVLNDLAINLRLSGRQEDGQRHAEEARAIFYAQGDLPMVADNLAQQAWSDFHQLRFADALHWVQEAATLCRRIENGWNLSLAGGTRGLVHMMLGAWGDALADFEESRHVGKAAGCAIAHILFTSRLGALLRTLGEANQAQALHEEAYAETCQHAPFALAAMEAQLAQDAFAVGQAEQGEQWLRAARSHQPEGAISRAWIMLADLPLAVVTGAQVTGDWAQAHTLVSQTLAEAQRRRLPIYLPMLEIAQGHCCHASGQLEAAEAHLQTAITLAQRANAIPLLWQAHHLQAALCRRHQRPHEAQVHQQQAAVHVRALAASLPDSHLRHSFLMTPAVQATLSAP